MSTLPHPSLIAPTMLAISPLTAFLWLHRAARRLECAPVHQLDGPSDIQAILQKEWLIGGLHPAFQGLVANRLHKRIEFATPLPPTDVALAYRKCADEEFGPLLHPLEREHADLAQRLEMGVEADGVHTASDVFVVMSVVTDYGERISSHAAQAGRMFASKLPPIPAWAIVLGWLLIVQQVAVKPDETLVSLDGLAKFVGARLSAEDKAIVQLGLGVDGIELEHLRFGVSLAWKSLLDVAMSERSRHAGTAYACLLHKHHPLPPSRPFRCGEDGCYVHSVGERAADLHVRISALVRQLLRELEALTPA